MAEGLVRADPKRLLTRTEDLFNRGLDLRRVAEELALELRHVFLAKALGEPPAELADSEQKAVMALAKEADSAQLSRLFDILYTGIQEVAKAAQPRLAFEMVLLKAVELAPAASLPDLVARLERLASGQPAEPRKIAGASGGRSEPVPFRS
jgi:DNA polymerase-3 subunit gamma/tau